MTEQNKPTPEQTKELWEWCGLKWFWDHNPDCECGAVDNSEEKRSWHYFDKGEWHLATRFWHEPISINPDNLFKYALPKIKEKYGAVKAGGVCNKAICNDIEAKHQGDFAPYLFWAIWEVIHDK